MASIITREGHSVGKSESYNRSNHADFATSSELKAKQFSGIRNNSISDQREIWIEGDKRASMSNVVAEQFPQKWEKLYAETFALGEVKQVTSTR